MNYHLDGSDLLRHTLTQSVHISVTAAWKEPVPGWTISKNGPQGFFMGASKGVLRRLPVGTHLIYDYIPVDVVVNALIVAAYNVDHDRLVDDELTAVQETIIYFVHVTGSQESRFITVRRARATRLSGK